MTKPLLPTGCYDVLPPYARQESELSSALLSVFESFGYEQVSPPLLEYSDSLLSGRGAALSAQIFRVMDPTAHKVMGIRPDITMQIGRLAANLLATSPRPLRLCYNGLILRMQGDRFRGNRQLRQAGIELVGPASPDADAEVILVAAEALSRAGIKELSIDLNLPGIVSNLLSEEALENAQIELIFAAVAHKDVSALRTIPFRYRDALIGLLQCAGAADKALAAIDKLALPESAKKQCRDLEEVLSILRKAGNKNWAYTVDPAEVRGLAYHSGISFSIFVPGAMCEVGRGGRYHIENAAGGEEATGFTVYVETLRDILPSPEKTKRVFVPEGIASKDIAKLREDGYVVILALSEYGNEEDEARRLDCGFIWKNKNVRTLK